MCVPDILLPSEELAAYRRSDKYRQAIGVLEQVTPITRSTYRRAVAYLMVEICTSNAARPSHLVCMTLGDLKKSVYVQKRNAHVTRVTIQPFFMNFLIVKCYLFQIRHGDCIRTLFLSTGQMHQEPAHLRRCRCWHEAHAVCTHA